MTATRSSGRALSLVAWTCLAAAGLYHLYFHAAYTLDDAYISFRYARNLARGAGLTWNPGEYVKGYSNTLYTLLMSVPELFGQDPITLSKALGYASFAGILAAGVRSYVGHLEPTLRDRALWFALLCAASTSLAVHCMNGLETGFYAALVFAGVLRRVREQELGLRPWSALLFAAAVLTRPEGSLLFLAAALHDLLWRVWRRRFRLQDLAFYLGPALVYVLELWLSTRYYGAALPNTYYAKTSGTHGVLETLLGLWRGAQAQLREGSYLSLGMLGTGLGSLGFCLALPALFERRFQRRNCALTAVVLAQLVFIVRAGDDWAPAFRFGVPLLPPLFLLIAGSLGTLSALARRYQRPLGWVLAGALVALIIPRQISDSRAIDKERFVNAENKLVQGAFFATLAEPGSTLSSFDIGGQGYAAGGFDVLDTAGLTSRETVGCRRGGARCARYAELIMPELVRLHSNRARDAFVSKTVVRHAPYLALDGGKYLLLRALVFPSQLPKWLRPSPERAPLRAADAPDTATPRQELTVTLYFERRGPVNAVAERRLVWRSARGQSDAHASASVLTHVSSQEEWHEGELFADRVHLRAPDALGQHTLTWLSDPPTTVASVNVVERAAPRARELVAQASTGDTEARLQQLSRATRLDKSEARKPFQQAVVTFARELRAEASANQDALAALRGVQRARAWLVRAFWESGHALPELRRELDDNGALRARLIAQLLDTRGP